MKKICSSVHWGGINSSQLKTLQGRVFGLLQRFAEDELVQGTGPDVSRNAQEITRCDQLVQLEGAISITLTGSHIAVKDAGTN